MFKPILVYLSTSALILAALSAARWTADSGLSGTNELGSFLLRSDSASYRQILIDGYKFEAGRASNVAHFPGYPLAGWIVAFFSGLRAEWALFVANQLCLFATYLLFWKYCEHWCEKRDPAVANLALLAFGFWPPTLFFRLNFSESLFCLVYCLFLFSVQRRWGLLAVSFIAGAASGIRPVGVGLLGPLVLYVWDRRTTSLGRFGSVLWVIPVGCWGLLGFMVFQRLSFGNAFAFAETQAFWGYRQSQSIVDKSLALATFEPLWQNFDCSSVGYWRIRDPETPAVYSIEFANPIWFVGVGTVIVWGTLKGALTKFESCTSCALIIIPYVLRGHEMCTGSLGRFSSVVLPAYLIMGLALSRVPKVCVLMIGSLSLALLFTYARMFASGRPVY